MFNIITHHRFFHTDEVMAVALLDLFMLNGKYNLIRTRDNKIIKKHQNDLNSFVIDVGLHSHNNDVKKLSSVLVWPVSYGQSYAAKLQSKPHMYCR